MDDSGAQSKRKLLTTLAVLIVIVAIVAAAIALKPDDSKSDTSTPNSSTGTTDASSSDSNASYKDGTYTQTGGYNSPGGAEQIAITVTLQNGVITDTSAVSKANDSEAKQFQSKFIGAYKDLVVGKNIDDVQLSRVSGSSLTSEGFNNAIEQIKADAET